ncbi:MAG: sigma-70 family RNA polymerase sigma factor [Candidatus Omnitrophota bacterium]|jgi:RNA polymerase sigma-70 factor (ECF subfamily)
MQEIPEDIIRAAAQGDRHSFRIIYERFSDYVYGLAARILGQEQDAEEVTQDVFVQVYQRLKDFRFEASLKTWVYRITVNTAYNYYKRNKRRYKRLTDYKRDAEHAISVRAEGCEYPREIIDWLLGALPQDQRTCIILRSIENLSYEEISQILKVNINTVRSRVMRAREKLMSLKEVLRNEGR